MDKNYWEKYYSSQKAPEQPSLFAKFVMNNYVKEGTDLLELGCGNGRDSIFFARHGIKVTAIDQCAEDIDLLNKKTKINNLKFVCADFTKLDNVTLFDYVYSRFTLHSISEQEESDVVLWTAKNIKSGGKFFIEARGVKNELYKLGNPVLGQPDAYIYENHYRRFIHLNVLLGKLSRAGFEIIYSKEESGFAPFGDTDYVFIRVVASKK